ncbi:MAG TPA: hypothetical protein VGD71_14620 [Kribbella sp.]
MATRFDGMGSLSATAGGAGHCGQRSPIVWQALSPLSLLATGGIHLYLVLNGVGGVLGVLFMLNAVVLVVTTAPVLRMRSPSDRKSASEGRS